MRRTGEGLAKTRDDGELDESGDVCVGGWSAVYAFDWCGVCRNGLGALMNSDLDYWHRTLAGERLPVCEDYPQPGFYKRRAPGEKDGPWLPILFKRDDAGNVICGFQGKLVDPLEHWTWAAKTPVSKDAYLHHMTQQRWPDEVQEAPRSNLPSDPNERLKLEVDGLLERVQEQFFGSAKLADRAAADQASGVLAKAREYLKEADEHFDSEKKPWLEGSRKVDEAWGWRKPAEAAFKKLRSMLNVWLTEEDRRVKAEHARKLAEEQARIDAERKILEASDPALALVTPAEVPNVTPLKNVQVGGIGTKKTGARSVFTARIVDYDAAIAHFKNDQVVRDLIQSLANGVARSGKGTIQIPGCEIIESKAAA